MPRSRFIHFFTFFTLCCVFFSLFFAIEKKAVFSPVTTHFKFGYAIPNLYARTINLAVNLPLDLVCWVKTEQELTRPSITVWDDKGVAVSLKVIEQHQWWRHNPPYLKNIMPRALEIRLAPQSGK